MAISIDRVYQKVLAFANKEQRGYITPQEFNLFAHQAQIEIFEQYFYDVNQWTRQHGNDTEFSDMLTNLQEKIDLFHTYKDSIDVISNYGDINPDVSLPDLYRIGRVNIAYANGPRSTAEYMSFSEEGLYSDSPLTIYTKKRPIYQRYLRTDGISKYLKIRPYPTRNTVTVNKDKVQIFYTRKPIQPNWNHMIVNDKALYNSPASTDFELHPSEESELVYRILAFAGISMQKPTLTQTAAGLEQAKVQQEKQ